MWHRSNFYFELLFVKGPYGINLTIMGDYIGDIGQNIYFFYWRFMCFECQWWIYIDPVTLEFIWRII